MARIAGVEGGGTKFVAAIAETRSDGPPHIVDRIRVPTAGDPSETIDPVAEWIAASGATAIGIATFGPLDLTAGSLRDTPKESWSGFPVRDRLLAGFDEPPACVIDTDVNGAALAEWRWGAASGTGVAVYVTVGTGIGGGAIVAGAPVHGLSHPEMGHITVPRHPGDHIESLCRWHDSCLEGLASGKAIAARTGVSPEHLGPDDPSWEIEVHYLAHGLRDLVFVLSPDVIVLGGGVSQVPGLPERVGDELARQLGDYVPGPRLVVPAFGQDAGLYGALALAAGIVPS